MSEYKGINLTKINGIQKINFPKTMTDSVSVRLAFEKFDTKNLDEVGKCIQNHVEKLFQKQVEDTEMFIICEMAKMFLEEKEKWKRVVERLEEELELTDKEKRRCIHENPLQFDEAKGYARGIANAIEIVKEEGGMNE